MFDKWANRFVSEPDLMRSYLSNSNAAREIAYSVYQYFVNTRQIAEIETIDKKQKERIWEAVKQRCLSKEDSIKLAKVFYLFEYILQTEIK